MCNNDMYVVKNKIVFYYIVDSFINFVMSDLLSG